MIPSEFEEIHPAIKYLYYSDAIFHCMIAHKAEELDKIPYDMMLILNNVMDIQKLIYISEHKRMYENLLLRQIYRAPYSDLKNDGVFKATDDLYSKWNHELEEWLRARLSPESKEKRLS